jgi:hypothetical protein
MVAVDELITSMICTLLLCYLFGDWNRFIHFVIFFQEDAGKDDSTVCFFLALLRYIFLFTCIKIYISELRYTVYFFLVILARVRPLTLRRLRNLRK